MTNYTRRPNRFLRPKRDHITPLDRVQSKLRSLVAAERVLSAAFHTMAPRRREAFRQNMRAGVSR